MEIQTKLITQTVKRGKIQITNIINKIGVMDMNSIDFEDEKRSIMKMLALTFDSLDKMYQFLGRQ